MQREKQKKIIDYFNVKPFINPSIEFRLIVNFIKKYLRKNILIHTLVLGISGGQDSTLTGKICQQVINEMRKENNSKYYQFIAVFLPYGKQNDEKDCYSAIKFINPDRLIQINIKKAVKSSEYSLNKSGINISDYVKGNEKARERMKVQYSIASMNKGIVVGTGHASEFVTGFFTKYGDGGVDINPLFSLNKRQGKLILQYLNCPENLYLKTPTADLEDKKPSLPDEEVLGVKYKIIDDYLEGKKIDIIYAKIIENWYFSTIHKRQLPINIFSNF